MSLALLAGVSLVVSGQPPQAASVSPAMLNAAIQFLKCQDIRVGAGQRSVGESLKRLGGSIRDLGTPFVPTLVKPTINKNTKDSEDEK